jgi:hypothetical protein
MGLGVDAQIRAVLGVVIRRVELENHQTKRWIENDRGQDEKFGRANHANHDVPMAVRLTMQDMLSAVAGVDLEARSLKRGQQKRKNQHDFVCETSRGVQQVGIWRTAQSRAEHNRAMHFVDAIEKT